MLTEVKRFEAKFLGMPIGREPSVGPKKGKLLRSPDPANLVGIGEIDARKDSPTYGMRSCIVGRVYELNQWQLNNFGAAFEVVKEIKGYVIDDGRTDEAEALARKQYQQESAARRAKEEKAMKDVARKEEEDRQLQEKKELEASLAAKKAEQDKVVKEAKEEAKKKK